MPSALLLLLPLEMIVVYRRKLTLICALCFVMSIGLHYLDDTFSGKDKFATLRDLDVVKEVLVFFKMPKVRKNKLTTLILAIQVLLNLRS